ncbi:hypothetical protein [Pediococcus argentinicus]|uniref:hypothetical protein n=1 Tax=Pediococcus argentinicus TaxID=480391 RepID=UPI0011BF5277|nr:hypothetical protein [Pediococcus argentinicus]NKZ22489.1 hypothetical protein [Pediococcus argentinicus]
MEDGNTIPLSTKFGTYTTVSELSKIKKCLESKTKVLCINDVKLKNVDLEDTKRQLDTLLQSKFPNKSSFEK